MDNLQNKNRYSEALDIDENIINNYLKIKFHDSKLEDEFNDYLIKNSKKMRILTNIVSLIILFIRILFNFSKANHYYYFIDLGLGIIAISLFITTHFLIKNLKIVRILTYLFSILIIIINCSSIIYLSINFNYSRFGIAIRESYLLLLISIIELLNCIEYNVFVALFIFTINFAISIFLSISHSYITDNESLKDIIIIFIILLLCIFMKKLNSYFIREYFLIKFKNGKYFSYSLDLLNNFNAFYIGVKNEKFLTFNNTFSDFIKNSKTIKELLHKSEKELNEEKENDISFNKIPYSGVNIKNNENNFNKQIQKKFVIMKLIQNMENKINSEIFKAHKSQNVVNISLFKNNQPEDKHRENLVNIRSHDLNKSFLNNEEIHLTKLNGLQNILRRTKTFREDYVHFRNKNLNEENPSIRFESTENNIPHPEIKDQSLILLSQENQMKNNFIEKKYKIDVEYLHDNFYKFSDELGELYFRNIKLKKLASEFSDLKENNLYDIYKELNSREMSNLIQGKFCLIGEFFCKEANKYFEVFIRKSENYENLFEFLIYDNTQVKEAQDSFTFLKSMFFSKIAHEFKTPVNSIIGLINKININFPIVKSNLKLQNVLNQIDSLSNYVIILIQDIIEFSKIYTIKRESMEEDKKSIKPINLKFSKINLKEIIFFCKGILKTLLKNKNKEKYIEIKVFYDERISNYEIISDEFRLKQILLNLISNAVKFTNAGSIMIQSILEKNENIQHSIFSFVRLSIIDTGIGIKKANLSQLLINKNFDDLNLSSDICHESFGIGLRMSKFLSGILNHKLEIESTYGKGSSFSLMIKSEKIQNSNISLNDETNKLEILSSISVDKIYEKSKSNENAIVIFPYFLNNKSFNHKLIYKKKKISLFDNSIKRNNKKIVYYHDENFRKLHENIYENTLQNFFDSSKFESEHNYRNSNIKFEDNSYNSNVCAKHIDNLLHKDSIIIKSVKDYKSFNNYSNSLQIKSKKSRTFDSSSNKNFIKANKYINKRNFNSIFYYPTPETKDDETVKFSRNFENPYKNNIFRFHSFVSSSSDPPSNKDLKGCLLSNSEVKQIASDEFSENVISFVKRSKFIDNLKVKKDNDTHSSQEINLENNFRKIILIADDHVYIRDTLKNIINKILLKKKINKEFIVKGISDGSEIINLVIKDQFKSNQIKCIITDENMEFINGSEAVRILKNLERKNKIKGCPIASITAFQDETMKTAILNVGVDYILSKPCTENDIENFFEKYNVFEDQL